MGKFLVAVISWALSTWLLKLSATLGIAVFTYKSLYSLVESGLDLIQPMLSQLPSSILNLLAIAGVPEAMSLIASALLTRAAINSAKAFVGVIT